MFQEQKAEENISNIKLYFFHKTRSKFFVVQYMSDVLTRFDIHDLSSLVLQMVTLSAHTSSLAMLFQLFITLCENELRRTVLFARGFTILYEFPLVSWRTLATLNSFVVNVKFVVQDLI